MEKIVSALRKQGKLFTMIFTCAYALFMLLYTIGVMSEGGTDIIFGALLFIVAFLGLAGALVYAIATGKDKAAKFIGTAYMAFVAVSAVYGLLSGSRYGTSVSDVMFVFDLLASVCAVAVFAIVIFGTFSDKAGNGNTFEIVKLCCVAGYILFALVARCLEFGVFGQVANEWGYNVPWYQIMNVIANICILPALCFGYILLFTEDTGSSAPAPTEKKEEVKTEEKPAEEPAPEAADAAEETPAEAE